MLPIIGTIVAVYAVTRLVLVAVESTSLKNRSAVITAIIILPILAILFLTFLLNATAPDAGQFPG